MRFDDFPIAELAHEIVRGQTNLHRRVSTQQRKSDVFRTQQVLPSDCVGTERRLD